MPSPSHTQGNTPRGTSYLVAVLLEYIRSLHEHGIKVHHCFYWCGPRPANPCRHCAAVLAPSLVVGALQRRDLDADAVSAPVLLPVRMPLPALAAHRPQACRPAKSLDTILWEEVNVSHVEVLCRFALPNCQRHNCNECCRQVAPTSAVPRAGRLDLRRDAGEPLGHHWTAGSYQFASL